MKYKMRPAIWVHDLEDALREELSEEIMEEVEDLRSFLFDDNYTNDSYQIYYIDDFIEITPTMSDENAKIVSLENTIIAFLQEKFPEHDAVLIDVSW